MILKLIVNAQYPHAERLVSIAAGGNTLIVNWWDLCQQKCHLFQTSTKSPLVVDNNLQLNCSKMSNHPSTACRWWGSVQTAFFRSLSLPPPPLSLSLSFSLSPALSLSLSGVLSLSVSASLSLSVSLSLSLSLSPLSLSLSLSLFLSLSLIISLSLSLSLSLPIYLSFCFSSRKSHLSQLSSASIFILTMVFSWPSLEMVSERKYYKVRVWNSISFPQFFFIIISLLARTCKLADIRKVTKECVSWPSHNESTPRVDLFKMEEVYFSCKSHSTQTGLIVRIMIKPELRWLTYDVAPLTWASAHAGGDICPCA